MYWRFVIIFLQYHLPSFSQAKVLELINLARYYADHFPDSEKDLLPTSLGNTIQAFEIYPLIMYGVDPIPMWSRLLAVVPKEYQESIASAKALTDVWLNLYLLSLVFIIEYIVLAFHSHQFLTPWILVLALLSALFASSRVVNAAVAWGDCFRGAFDLYLSQLALKLGYSLENNEREQVRLFWTTVSQAILFRLPEQLDDLNRLALILPQEELRQIQTNNDQTEANSGTNFSAVDKAQKGQ